MPGALDDLAKHVEALLGRKLVRHHVALGEVTLIIEPEHVAEVLTILRDDGQCQFEQLIDVCGVDYPERSKRFDVVYHLLSPRKNQRLRVKCETDADTPVPSVVDLFPCANWYEREA
jgi:NADH-quinone oxidoreductase subunit C